MSPESRDRVAQVKDPQFLRKLYTDLLGKASPGYLGKLQQDPHDGIALMAAWQWVRNSIPDTTKSDADWTGPVGRLDRAAVHRFVGFVEGRLKVPVPDW